MAVLLAMVVTCPKDAAHYDAITTSISEKSSVAKPIVKYVLDKGVKTFGRSWAAPWASTESFYLEKPIIRRWV